VEAVAGTVAELIQMPDMPYFIAKGEDPRGFVIGAYNLTAGARISGRRQAMLGKTTAKNLKKQVGDTLRISDTGYQVVGIYETGVALEDGGAVIPLDDAQRAFDKRSQLSYLSVKVRDAREIDAVKRRIETQFPDVVAARSGEATKQSEALDLYRSFGWFLGIFAVLVGGLGMMNTTLMSVLERTREIGVLRALGWRRRRVVGLILGESLVVAGLGGAVGVLLGVALTALASLSPAVESMLQGVFTPRLFLQAMLLALALGAISGVYPAWRASRLQPVEAMRQEGGAGARIGPAAAALGRHIPWSSMRNLLRRPTRTIVTVMGIGIGVGFVVALMAVTEGMKGAYNQMASAGQSDLLAEQRSASDLAVSRIDERVADRLRQDPEVASVSGLLIGTASTADTPYLFVFGLDTAEDYIQHFRVREGRSIQRPREVMLGRSAANSMRKHVGDRLQLAGSSFNVVGIYENGTIYEDIAVTMSLRDAQERFGKARNVSLLAIRLRDPSRAAGAAMRLESEHPELMVNVSSQATERVQDFASTYAVLDALVALTMVVGGIVMTNTVLMSVFERTQEIGVLRAMGWKRRRVIASVLAEALATSGLATVVGIALGAGLGWLLTLEPSMGPFLTPVFRPSLFLQVTTMALVLSIVGGLYPAWRAANLQPIEALRYE
jgi:ABC-type antimicrobial peptide transport system permease subunit